MYKTKQNKLSKEDVATIIFFANQLGYLGGQTSDAKKTEIAVKASSVLGHEWSVHSVKRALSASYQKNYSLTKHEKNGSKIPFSVAEWVDSAYEEIPGESFMARSRLLIDKMKDKWGFSLSYSSIYKIVNGYDYLSESTKKEESERLETQIKQTTNPEKIPQLEPVMVDSCLDEEPSQYEQLALRFDDKCKVYPGIFTTSDRAVSTYKEICSRMGFDEKKLLSRICTAAFETFVTIMGGENAR